MAFIDYYKVLGIKKNATDAEIKKAYRKHARKYHPDLNPDDKVAERKFKEINEANEVLGNKENRKKYDKYGKDWMHAEEIEKQKASRGYRSRSTGGFSTGGFSADDFANSQYSDFFESMFGRQSNGRTSLRQKGRDINANVRLDLKEVYTSEKRTLTINGKSIRLTIPAGVKDGQIIKIKGQGSPGQNGGPRGDLYLTFMITNNTKFTRKKDNLYTTVDVDLYTAILGGELLVDTFTGSAKLKLKPGTQNGTKVKLKSKGFPKYKKEGEFGDLYITYNVILPTKLSEREKELFEELASVVK